MKRSEVTNVRTTDPGGWTEFKITTVKSYVWCNRRNSVHEGTLDSDDYDDDARRDGCELSDHHLLFRMVADKEIS